MENGWGQDNPAFRQLFTTAFFPDGSKEVLDALNELQRRATSPQSAVRILSAIGDIDLRPELSRVRAHNLGDAWSKRRRDSVPVMDKS